VNDRHANDHWGQQPAPDSARGICFCLVYDLCCWLSTGRRAVPEELEEYTLVWLRAIDDPRRRMDRYVNPAVLNSWERALQPFFASGVALEPELGESGSFHDLGRDAAGRVRCELHFGNRSSVLDRHMRRYQLPPYDWALSVLLSPEPDGFVENATLRLL
jgi:hypothetical protein